MVGAMARELRQLEETLRSPWADFIAKFMTVRNLREGLEDHARLATEQTITTLAGVLVDPKVTAERQGLFLFREAADALRAIFTAPGSGLADQALDVLYQVLRRGSGAAQRAVGEALAGLPLALSGPAVRFPSPGPLPSLSWQELLQAVGNACDPAEIRFVGRSLVARLADQAGLLVVKLARPHDCIEALVRETFWLWQLREVGIRFPAPFAIPTSVSKGQGFGFRLRDLPLSPPAGLALHPQRFGIAFVAPPDYYRYPNEPAGDPGLTDSRFRSLMADNALVLGSLTGRGIVHDALIPLFHNRVQQERREDSGLYDWALGGRLDRWLESCRHPNFGASGLRDFEHLVAIDALPCSLYQQLGAHFLSMLLVAASYFRNKEPQLRGLDRQGQPVDARHLFDPSLLATVVEGVYRNYHLGFAGVAAPEALPFDLDRLVARMVDEMGVDLHMEEVLRLVDQETMDDAAFSSFLLDRGFSPRQCARYRRGQADIVIHTGPHLGGFNQPISLPEMVTAVGAMAAMCVLGRYQWEQRQETGQREKGIGRSCL